MGTSAINFTDSHILGFLVNLGDAHHPHFLKLGKELVRLRSLSYGGRWWALENKKEFLHFHN
jgi:hypothetical protein